jgi:threonyl-tRNA synthetase
VSGAIRVTLPDGSVREVPAGTSARQVAEGIGAGLARAALAARVDGAIWDLDRPLQRDAALAILTDRDPTPSRSCIPGTFSPPRWSCFPARGSASVDRGRLLRLPGGPRSPDTWPPEQKMAEVAKRDYPFVREVVDRSEANRSPTTRSSWADAELGDDETITVCTDGTFQDLCRGPHVPSTGRLKHFKLLHAAGACGGATSGDRCSSASTAPPGSRRKTSTPAPPAGGARKRDLQVIGRQLDLFSSRDRGPELVLWHPKGAMIMAALPGGRDDNVASG